VAAVHESEAARNATERVALFARPARWLARRGGHARRGRPRPGEGRGGWGMHVELYANEARRTAGGNGPDYGA
jgi:hypothetical protein